MAPTRPNLLNVCGLDISVETLGEAADAMILHCGRARHDADRPLFVTSINGQVLSLCARDAAVRRLFEQADVIHCDGQPLVLLSRLIGSRALPERVATTDLFPLVAERAARSGVSFYLLGGSPAVNVKLRQVVASRYPGLVIAGASHGYLSAEAETRVVAEIAGLKPDVLWVALGVPLEQRFVLRHRDALRGVGVIKTSGGLFDFISGTAARAPVLMQRAGLEWLFRLRREPRRLFWRYAVSNPHALYLMIRSLAGSRPTRTRETSRP